MGRAKDIIVKVIPAKIANEFVRKHHYSGKVVNNSSLHFGCFLDGQLHGVISYGSPMVKAEVIGLVEGTRWDGLLELNRMAFDEHLPKNSESRCIAITIRLIKKQAPQVKWVISFADASLCGDGTIYRASGFSLTSIKKNTSIYKTPDGEVACTMTYGKAQWSKKNNGRGSGPHYLKSIGAERVSGYQLRYIYLIDKTMKITSKILPFSAIDAKGAGMYKGKKISIAERRKQAAAEETGSGVQSETGGLTPTLPLHFDEADNGSET